MIKKLTLAFSGVALAAAATISGSVGQGATDTGDSNVATVEAFETKAEAQSHAEPHATTVADIKRAAKLGDTSAQVLGWDVPWAMSYHLEASCAPYAGVIAQGAAAWNQLSEGGGTPVECRTDYITDCGGGAFVVGCNWGAGQRIALFPGGVNDDALLAAHEFGHDWYGHSSYQCAGWGSPAEVMAPSICNLAGSQGRM
jgi:hypothetical protein